MKKIIKLGCFFYFLETEIFNMTSTKPSNSDKGTLLNSHQQPKKTTSSVAHKTAPPEKISYSVAHAIPGRIRFRIPRLVKDSEYANKLKLVIESDSRTTDVRVNPTAGSIVVTYQPGVISDQQMRQHLVNLIQTAPNIVLPKQATAKSILGAIFDAVINLLDSTRNINKARTAIVYGQPKTDIWERLLSTTESMIKRLKSGIMFILPNKRLQARSAPKEVGLQLERLQAAGVDARSGGSDMGEAVAT
ncbi:MAG: hypothetical protein KME57_13135 [Scytonema hyalinum WJT4-NPBG1]|nr:hypothetical protein [Scytonema hyalinum WJT4-NPBG1]